MTLIAHRTNAKAPYEMLVLIDTLMLLDEAECSPNTWCRQPSHYSQPASEYKLLVLEGNITWFEALEVCRERHEAELALHSTLFKRDYGWVSKQKNSMETGS